MLFCSCCRYAGVKAAWVPYATWDALANAGDKGELNSLVKMMNVFGTSTLKVLHKIERTMVSWGAGSML